MVQTLATISLFAAVGAFALASILLNEGSHATRRRERKRAAQERRRRAAWSPSLVSRCPELPPRPPAPSSFSRRVSALRARVGAGVGSVRAREVKRAVLASMLLALAALLRRPAQRVPSTVRRAMTPDRSRWSSLMPRRGSRRGRMPSLHW